MQNRLRTLSFCFCAVMLSLIGVTPLLFAQGSVTDAYNAVQSGINANSGGTVPLNQLGISQFPTRGGGAALGYEGISGGGWADTWSGSSGTGSGSGGGTGGSGANNRPGGGVFVHPNGVMLRFAAFDTGMLTRQQLNAARASYGLSGNVAASSPMRCISLNRLERAVIESNGMLTEEMKYLAGIQRIRYVFYYPESKDIVIAGHAEGWFPGHEDMMVGITTGQPVLELRHLVTALRVYAPGREVVEVVGCSIDPTPEGNVRLQEFVSQFGGANTPAGRQAFIDGIRQSIGWQTVRVDGVPATTDAARLMVAADYRMKRIALGADDKPVRQLTTFIEKTVPNAPDAAFRWWFIPDYESVILTEDRTGLQLVGDGVKLVGENEIVDSTGDRSTLSGKLDPGSTAFTQSFTRQYPQIAKQALVFAQLRNWIDMLVCAAHIQRDDFYGQSGWSMEFFGDEAKYPLEVYTAPTAVEPLVGTARRGNLLLAPVGGGVVIDADLVLDDAKPDTDGKVAEERAKVGLNLPEGVWWWDVR